MKSPYLFSKAPVRRAALAVVLAATVAACGGPPKPQGFDRLYRGLSESLPRIDPTVLKGRRILIDPGHGGHFSGTVGRDSLEESSVNLGVSLYLWGLLHEAGADVHLTRAIDRDFLSIEDSSLASDLRTRVAFADSLEPDVLVSIHHNAQPQRDASKNVVETYYRAGDPASLDLAFAVHRHLMRNLGIENGGVRQGNYLILRESNAPAVLGESSYLTHPSVEEKLKLSKAQKLEAEAYFLGILEYFERGTPRVRCLSPADSHYSSVPTVIYELEDEGGTGIDPDGISMKLNGRPVTPIIDETVRRLTLPLPWDLPNGVYQTTLSARNIGGNTSPTHQTRFAVDFPPEFAVFEFSPDRLPPKGDVVRVRVRLLDGRGLPIADGEEVSVTTAVSVDTAWGTVKNGSIDVTVRTPPAAEPVTVYAGCRGQRFETTINVDSDPQFATRGYYIRDAITGRPIDGATVRPMGMSAESASSNGTYVDIRRSRPDSLPNDPTGREIVWMIEAPGYIPADRQESSLPDTIEMTPWFGGALTDLRFVVNPEAGRPSDTGIGQLGLSGSHANLLVARYLAGFLEAAGGRVLLTRTNDEVKTQEDIARVTNRFRANRFIEIRHRSAPADSELAVSTFHFPGSTNGKDLAQNVLDALEARLGRPAKGPLETVTYPLQQTACPAIIVGTPSIGILEEELRLAESWYQREQAYAIFLGVLNHYGVVDSGEVSIQIDAPEKGGWRVTLDKTWTLVTGEDGSVLFEKVPLGPRRVSIVRSGRLHRDAVQVTPAERVRLRFKPPVE